MAIWVVAVGKDVDEQLTPTDPVAANAWLFASRVDLPEGQPEGFTEYTEQISEAQRTAVRGLYECHGPEAIVDIADAAEIPHHVGVAVLVA